MQLGLFGRTSATAWEMSTGMSGNETLFIIVGGLCMILTATLGYKGLEFLSKLAVPLLLLLMIGSVLEDITESHFY